MSSTPKPKHVNTDKHSDNVISILSAMDDKARRQFAERANKAFEQRIKTAKDLNGAFSFNSKEFNYEITDKANDEQVSKPWYQWLLSIVSLSFIKK